MTAQRLTLTLSLEPEHLSALLDALDLLSRIGMGQFEEVLDHAPQIGDVDRNHARRVLDDAKVTLTHMEPNAYFSIHDREHVPEPSRAAFDLLQVVRKQYAERLCFDRYSVWRNEPLPMTNLALPTAEIGEVKP